MYIATIPNRSSPPAMLLRESFRQNGRVKTRTLANLSHWPRHKIETFRKLLQDETLLTPDQLFHIEESLPHGHVEVVLGTIHRLGVDSLIDSKRSRQRDLVVAMIADRLIHGSSKLATTRLMSTTTLAEELSVGDAAVDDLYEAMDLLLGRQEKIENKLAKRHLQAGSLVLYDVSSSYYEGKTCPLAQYGHDRDGKTGLPIIVYGVLTDCEGRPVAVDVYPGNTGDPTTLPDQVEKLRERFGLSRVVLVGDRGMLTETRIDTFKKYPGLGWISALRSEAIRELMKSGTLQLSLFDQRNLAEITSSEYPHERLIACFNPLLAQDRRRTREELLQATQKRLDKLVAEVCRRRKKPLKKDEIAIKFGTIVNRYKMKKHVIFTIEEGRFEWAFNQESIGREKQLDGIYVIRTSEETVSPEETVRRYKSLSQVERAFRCLKGIDLRIRPIHHRTEDHVRAHIFLCMLAYYVEWHMRKALAPLLFEDEELSENRKTRDPVAPAKDSESVKRKKLSKKTGEGLPVQSFETLLAQLATRCRITCRIKKDPPAPVFKQMTERTPLQKKAMALLGL